MSGRASTFVPLNTYNDNNRPEDLDKYLVVRSNRGGEDRLLWVAKRALLLRRDANHNHVNDTYPTIVVSPNNENRIYLMIATNNPNRGGAKTRNAATAWTSSSIRKRK